MEVMKHKAAAARKFRNAVRIAQPRVPAPLPAGFYVTDPGRTPAILETVRNLPAGIGVIFRHFGMREQRLLAPDLAGLCRAQRRTLLVGADTSLARRIGACGVHWPARLAASASHCPGLKTMSVHSVSEFRQAQRLGMDAVLISTVFRSDSPSSAAPIGLARLARYRRRGGPVIYALGGIGASNCEQTARVAGFAAVSGIEEVFGPRT